MGLAQDFPVSWQQCYSWFEELPTDGRQYEAGMQHDGAVVV
jgi:hypothetical protein